MLHRRLLSLVLMVFVLATANVLAALTIDFVDVGQGDAAVIVHSSGSVILIDGGTEHAGRDQLVPFLESLDITNIHTIIATHPHADHIGGLIPVLERFPVGQVFADGQVHTTRTYERFLETLLNRGIPFYLARAGRTVHVPNIDVVEFLHPTEPFLDGLNDNSVVVRLGHHGTYVLFTGDVEYAAEEMLLNRGFNVTADVLKVSHHGSRTSTSRRFLQQVSPSYAVISAGADNRYGHPHDEVVNRLAEAGVDVLSTAQHGTVRMVIEETHWSLEPLQAASRSLAAGQSPLRVSHASSDQLQAIPGIGPVLAQRIEEHRDTYGIEHWDDLLNIQGIGPATLKRIKEHAVLH